MSNEMRYEELDKAALVAMVKEKDAIIQKLRGEIDLLRAQGRNVPRRRNEKVDVSKVVVEDKIQPMLNMQPLRRKAKMFRAPTVGLLFGRKGQPLWGAPSAQADGAHITYLLPMEALCCTLLVGAYTPDVLLVIALAAQVTFVHKDSPIALSIVINNNSGDSSGNTPTESRELEESNDEEAIEKPAISPNWYHDVVFAANRNPQGTLRNLVDGMIAKQPPPARQRAKSSHIQKHHSNETWLRQKHHPYETWNVVLSRKPTISTVLAPRVCTNFPMHLAYLGAASTINFSIQSSQRVNVECLTDAIVGALLNDDSTSIRMLCSDAVVFSVAFGGNPEKLFNGVLSRHSRIFDYCRELRVPRCLATLLRFVSKQPEFHELQSRAVVAVHECDPKLRYEFFLGKAFFSTSDEN